MIFQHIWSTIPCKPNLLFHINLTLLQLNSLDCTRFLSSMTCLKNFLCVMTFENYKICIFRFKWRQTLAFHWHPNTFLHFGSKLILFVSGHDALFKKYKNMANNLLVAINNCSFDYLYKIEFINWFDKFLYLRLACTVCIRYTFENMLWKKKQNCK